MHVKLLYLHTIILDSLHSEYPFYLSWLGADVPAMNLYDTTIAAPTRRITSSRQRMSPVDRDPDLTSATSASIRAGMSPVRNYSISVANIVFTIDNHILILILNL